MRCRTWRGTSGTSDWVAVISLKICLRFVSLEGREEELTGLVESVEPNTGGCVVFGEGIGSIMSGKISMLGYTLKLVFKGKIIQHLLRWK